MSRGVWCLGGGGGGVGRLTGTEFLIGGLGRGQTRGDRMRAKMRSWLPLLYLAGLSYSEPADAQRVDALGPEVRKYLRVNTPKVILEHVQIIDGTGAAPTPDQNIYIEGGKIKA